MTFYWFPQKPTVGANTDRWNDPLSCLLFFNTFFFFFLSAFLSSQTMSYTQDQTARKTLKHIKLFCVRLPKFSKRGQLHDGQMPVHRCGGEEVIRPNSNGFHSVCTICDIRHLLPLLSRYMWMHHLWKLTGWRGRQSKGYGVMLGHPF